MQTLEMNHELATYLAKVFHAGDQIGPEIVRLLKSNASFSHTEDPNYMILDCNAPQGGYHYALVLETVCMNGVPTGYARVAQQIVTSDYSDAVFGVTVQYLIDTNDVRADTFSEALRHSRTLP